MICLEASLTLKISKRGSEVASTLRMSGYQSLSFVGNGHDRMEKSEA